MSNIHPRTIQLKVGDKTLSVSNWSKLRNIRKKTIYDRIRAKWPPEQIIGLEPRPSRTDHVGPRPRKNKLTEPVELKEVVRIVEVIDHILTGRAAREIRNRAGLSIDQAAESLGWTMSSLWEMEMGRTKWRQKRIDHFNEVAKGWVA